MHCNIPFELKIVSLQSENSPREKIIAAIKSEGKQNSPLPPAHTCTAAGSREIRQENSSSALSLDNFFAFLGKKKKKKKKLNL